MDKADKKYIKLIRSLLKEKQVRDETGLFVAEGLKAVKDIAAKGHDIDSVLVSHAFAAEENNSTLISHFKGRGVAVRSVSGAEFDKISSLRHPEGVLAVLKKSVSQKKMLKETDRTLAVLCDSVQDPGNLGSIVRTAVAFGASCLILTGDPVDIYNPKVVRSSSGTILDIPVFCLSYRDLAALKDAGYRIYVSHTGDDGGVDINCMKSVGKRAIVVFGSEGKGVSGEVSDMADETFYIPIDERTESLNVTSAVAVTLFVLTRGRKNG